MRLSDPIGAAQALRTLAGAGLIRPYGPMTTLAALHGVRRWGFAPATGVGIGAKRVPARAAVVDDDGVLTWRELHERGSALAHGLAAAGVQPGDRVGVLCRPSRHPYLMLIAAGRLGFDLVHLTPGIGRAPLTRALADQHVTTLVHDADLGDDVGDLGAVRQLVARGTDPRWASLDDLAADQPTTDPPTPATPSRMVLLTSGTTGTPKGVARDTLGGLDSAVGLLSRLPLRVGGVTAIAAPTSHAWGLAQLNLAVLLGSTVVLRARPDAATLLADVDAHDVDVVVTVPVVLRRLLEALPADTTPPAVRAVVVSGSRLEPALATAFMDRFGDVLHDLYGSSEVAWASVATPEDLRAAPGTVGRPPLGTTLRVVDGDGHDVAVDEVGRIVVGSALSVARYTSGAERSTVDGLVDTGDLGRLDAAGRLHVVGRADDMVVSGGENVFPDEVEDAVAAMDGVVECAAVGVPDDTFGQRLRVVLVLRPGTALDADAVRAHVRAHVGRHAVPRDVVCVEALPRNPAGKVLRAALAADPTPH